MRYYLYISDAKVNMLLPQVTGAERKTIAAKLGFDVKVLSGSISTQRTSLDNSVARLQAVESHLQLVEEIGTPDQPATWIQGDVAAKTVEIGEGAIIFLSEGPDLPPIPLMSGRLPSWILALGGSARHLIGSVAREKVDIPYSHLDQLVRGLKSLTEEHAVLALTSREDQLGDLLAPSVDQGFRAWIDAICAARSRAQGPAQRIHFLAKRLASDRTGRTVVTMATPLYVALAD